MIHTPQEHAMIGSSIKDHYKQFPYRPIGITDGKISVEECYQRRKDDQIITTLACFFGRLGFAHATIEDLELDKNSQDYGCTTRDPQFIEWVYTRKPCEKEEVPYRREQ